MKIQLASLAIAACLAMACASSQPASNVIKDAEEAMLNADSAKECAAQTYALAQKALAEAQEAQARGDAETARQKARLAQTLANQAKDEAIMNAEDCERQRAAALAMHEKLADSGNIVDDIDVVVRGDVEFEIVYFDFDESTLSSAAVKSITANIGILRQKPGLAVQLAAHTDERGTTEYNLALSQKRGESVRVYMTTMGIEPRRLTVVPYGKEKPVALGSREQDHALNRRVEFIAR
ncbi:MAG: OmpA family protein [Proteobacteria bacterium]|nr:OmpA family protein [Pseudomonadota bacterium]